MFYHSQTSYIIETLHEDTDHNSHFPTSFWLPWLYYKITAASGGWNWKWKFVLVGPMCECHIHTCTTAVLWTERQTGSVNDQGTVYCFCFTIKIHKLEKERNDTESGAERKKGVLVTWDCVWQFDFKDTNHVIKHVKEAYMITLKRLRLSCGCHNCVFSFWMPLLRFCYHFVWIFFLFFFWTINVSMKKIFLPLHVLSWYKLTPWWAGM